MAHLRTIQPLSISGILSLSMLAGVMLTAPSVQAQTPKPAAGAGQSRSITPSAPNVVRPTAIQAEGLLSLPGGQRLTNEAEQAIRSQNMPLALKKLQEARQVYNQLSNFYQGLTASFSGVDTRVVESQRKKALDTAQLRDETTYRLAGVHRAMNQSDLAVPLLVQILQSQQPTRELGKQAYQQLFEIGFVDVQYPSQAQTPEPAAGDGQARPTDSSAANAARPTATQAAGLLSLPGGQRLTNEAEQAIRSQNMPLALKKLQEARQVYNQLSNLYQDLANSFSGVDARVAESQRKKALDTAQLRDETTYRLAVVHRAMDQSDLAVPLLLQVIRSQQPTRDFGKQAYQQLFELGFVDVQYPRTAESNR